MRLRKQFGIRLLQLGSCAFITSVKTPVDSDANAVISAKQWKRYMGNISARRTAFGSSSSSKPNLPRRAATRVPPPPRRPYRRRAQRPWPGRAGPVPLRQPSTRPWLPAEVPRGGTVGASPARRGWRPAARPARATARRRRWRGRRPLRTRPAAARAWGGGDGRF